jgi:hypothetical protein
VNLGFKGCGTVTRSAPFGLPGSAALSAGDTFRMAARCAQITHGHPTGYYDAGAFAAMVHHLVEGDSLEDTVLQAMRLLARHPGHDDMSRALHEALDPAVESDPAPEQLVAGWVAKRHGPSRCTAPWRATRSARPCCLRSTTPATATPPAHLRNLLGARHGDLALPAPWVQAVEGRGAICEVADDFSAQFQSGHSDLDGVRKPDG